MILRTIKRLREIYKKEAEISRAQRRIASMPFDYQALQTICDTVSSGYNVSITIKNKDGSTIQIERGKSQESVPYKTFAERFTEYQNKGKTT